MVAVSSVEIISFSSTYSGSCTYVAGAWSTTPVSPSVFEASSFTIPDLPSNLAFDCEQAESPTAIMITAIIAVIFFFFIVSSP